MTRIPDLFAPIAPEQCAVPPGTGVAVIAPSGAAVDPDAVARGIALLEAQGCRVYNYYNHARRHQRFGATDAERVAQLHAAAADPNVQVVMAIRGSYGLSRMLDAIDYDALAASGKLFVGFSDLTVLHLALFKRTGAVSFAGPMLCEGFGAQQISAPTVNHFWQCVTHAEHAIGVPVGANPALALEGTLWGGNLTMVAHLIGTPYFPAVDGGILFLEDIAEHPYRLERMLLQLHHAGALKKQQAILLGDFSGYRLAPHDNGYDFDAMLAYLRAELKLPILTGLPFGHIRDHATLAVGAHACVKADGDSWSLSFNAYPILAKQSVGNSAR
ncbi:MAG: muramoyltetrapeptide carboxypeptidase [Herbaspirillum sp.]|jgi:muramoyltetrapeptide carboxypeptidase|nr:muramoyltetrapeptide carboxypeptidase [Herbaspirillum sp.]